MYMYVCLSVCMYVYVYTCIHVFCACIYIHYIIYNTYAQVCCRGIITSTGRYILYVCYTYIYIYIYIHIYI